MWEYTILQKTGHAELVWGDLFGLIIMELLEHGLVVLTIDCHHPAVVILKPIWPKHSPSGFEGTETCDLPPFQVPLSDLLKVVLPPRKCCCGC